MIVAICILSILLCVSVFVIINLLRKIENIDDELTNVSLQVENMFSSLNDARLKMKQIDSKGWFQNDDETGSVFKGIDNQLNQLSNDWGIDNEVEE